MATSPCHASGWEMIGHLVWLNMLRRNKFGTPYMYVGVLS